MKSRMWWFNLARTVHLYSSSLLFVTLVFFCVTGFTLSRGWYDDDGARASSVELSLPPELAATLDPASWKPDLTALQALLTEAAGLGVPDSIELDQDYGEVALSYKAPAGDAQAIITSEGVLLDVQRGSTLAVLNDLHKNRNAGSAWAWFVEVSALAMLVFAVTGLIIVFQNRRRRGQSIWIICLGLATPVLLFLAFVPNIQVRG
ncbi:MAG: PepSY-associated TM helix domain-containing protein [Pseudomonadota bacterium]